MDGNPQQGGYKQKSPLLPILLVVMVIVVAIAAAVIVVTQNKGSADDTEGGGNRIGYATKGVTAVTEDGLQKAVEEMYAHKDDEPFHLWYKNAAFSENGKDFTCFLGNSADNTYDMYLQIFADAEHTDELFLSELIRPGTKFEQITLNRKLNPGNHTLYVGFTKVDDVDGEQIIHAQVFVAVDATVTGER